MRCSWGLHADTREVIVSTFLPSWVIVRVRQSRRLQHVGLWAYVATDRYLT